jgi:hypothetical protein
MNPRQHRNNQNEIPRIVIGLVSTIHIDTSVMASAFHRTNVEFGKHWSLSALA